MLSAKSTYNRWSGNEYFLYFKRNTLPSSCSANRQIHQVDSMCTGMENLAYPQTNWWDCGNVILGGIICLLKHFHSNGRDATVMINESMWASNQISIYLPGKLYKKQLMYYKRLTNMLTVELIIYRL